MNTSSNIIYPAEQGYPRNQWYVAAFSTEVVAGALLARRFLDVPVLLFRTESGAAVALHDRCPHRGLPLSLGRQIGERVRCGYHGIEFGIDGHCAHIPSQTGAPGNMTVTRYPLVEKWQWLWIWVGDPAQADPELIPDHAWLGLTREGYTATPFFMMEMAANYQFMHDNLLDSTHVSFLHTGALDSGDEMASATITIEQSGQLLSIAYDTPGSCFSESVAAYFRVEAGRPYDRILLNQTYVPSISIGKQSIRDPRHPATPPIELYAINAVTPASRSHSYVHHVQITSFDPQWQAADIEAVRGIVAQDKVALEAIQRDYDNYRDNREVSIRADSMGLRCRKLIQELMHTEQ